MTTPTKLFCICSLLMSCMFAYSSFVQLNDPDWFFWFPLYACACVVNLVNWAISSETAIICTAKVAKGAKWLGTALFIKVVIENLVSGTAAFCSLDVTERVVREKIGSGLVVISMFLHLKASSPAMQRKKRGIVRFADYRMAFLVGFSYGQPFVFSIVQKGEMVV